MARSVVVSKLSSDSKTDVRPIAALVSGVSSGVELIAQPSYVDIPDEWWENLLHRPFDKDAADPQKKMSPKANRITMRKSSMNMSMKITI